MVSLSKWLLATCKVLSWDNLCFYCHGLMTTVDAAEAGAVGGNVLGMVWSTLPVSSSEGKTASRKKHLNCHLSAHCCIYTELISLK